MTRESLVSAYRNSVGGHGIERNGELRILGVVEELVPEIEKERFQKHGVAHVKLPVDFAKIAFLVDTSPLTATSTITGYQITTGTEHLSLHLSNGKQPQREDLINLDPNRQIEGFYIITVAKSREGGNNAYDAKVFPLYKPLEI